MDMTIREKIYGAFFGYAIGDALGLGTEFMTCPEARRRYPDGLRSYSQIIRDAHRSMWKRGGWTNDTDDFIALAEVICGKGYPDYKTYARKIFENYKSRHDDIPSHMRWLFNEPGYLDHPIETAKDVWSRMKNLDASNEGLGREVLLGIWNENVEENALKFCGMTHPNSRCEAASIVIAMMSNSLMWHDRPADFGKLLNIAHRIDDSAMKYVEIAHDGNLSELNLDDPATLWYVRKTMGAALWAVWHCRTPREGLEALVDAAGDADTNAALGTSLLGIKYGYDALPRDLIDGLLDKERLETAAEAFTGAVEEKFGTGIK